MSGGEFFVIDQRIWHAAIDLGMDQAVCYLVMACGTGGDHQTTSWSINAVEKYTSIGRLTAKRAIAKLCDRGLAQQISAGTRPQYRLATGAPPPQPHEMLWLPNTLVTGAGSEIPPVELMQRTRDPMALRLLIDLYGAYHLTEYGGISRDVVRQDYQRTRIGQQGAWVAWGFHYRTKTVVWEPPHSAIVDAWTTPTVCHKLDNPPDGQNAGSDFFRRFGHLTDLGLVEWIPTLFADESDGPLIHPIGGGEIENRIGHGLRHRCRVDPHPGPARMGP
jgi:hypothetical protein